MDDVRDRIQHDLGLIRQLSLAFIYFRQRGQGLRGLPDQIRSGGCFRRAFIQDCQSLLRILRQRLGIRQSVAFPAKVFIFARL